jgi:hypothetical protein
MNTRVIEALDKAGWPEWDYRPRSGSAESVCPSRILKLFGSDFVDAGTSGGTFFYMHPTHAQALIERHLREWLAVRYVHIEPSFDENGHLECYRAWRREADDPDCISCFDTAPTYLAALAEAVIASEVK